MGPPYRFDRGEIVDPDQNFEKLTCHQHFIIVAYATASLSSKFIISDNQPG